MKILDEVALLDLSFGKANAMSAALLDGIDRAMNR